MTLLLLALLAQAPDAGAVAPTNEAVSSLDAAVAPADSSNAPDAGAPATVAAAPTEPRPPAARPAPDTSDIDAHRRQTVVTGSRTERRLEDAVVATEVITRAQIEAIGARDLGQLLQQQQGIELEYTFRGTGISLQGLGPEYVLVLIDGERVSGRVGNTLDLSRFSLRDVERVEIVKGPAAALYGSEAIAGVINLITRRVQKPLEVTARAQTGYRREPVQNETVNRLDPDLRGGVGLKWRALEARVGAGYQNRQPYDLNPNDVATSGAGFTRWDVDGSISVRPVDKLLLAARADYLRREIAAIDLAPSGAVFDRRQRSEQFNASAMVRVDATPSTTVTAHGGHSLYRDQLQQDQRGAVFLDTYTQSIDRLWQADLQVDHKAGNHALAVGGLFLNESLSSERLVTFGQRYRGGAFIQDEWEPFRRAADGFGLKFLPGLRVDVDSQFGVAPSPRLALRFDPTESLTLRAAYGWGFRAPSFQELYLRFENTSVGYVVQGNPDLKAETSYSLNVAADYRLPLQGWVISANIWHTDLTNLINVNTSQAVDPNNPTLFRYANVSSAYTQGIDASLRMRLSAGTYIDLGYVLTDARDADKHRQLEGRAVHKLNAQLAVRYRPTGLELVVRATYFGPRPFYVDSNADGVDEQIWVKGYVNVDAQLTWHFWQDRLALFAGIINIANSGDATYVPQPPRSVLAGAQFQY